MKVLSSRVNATPDNLHLPAIVLLLLLGICLRPLAAMEPAPERRVPAEWEPQAGTWLQWPGPYERSHETAFAQMSVIIARYQKLHILHATGGIRARAEQAIARAGGDPAHVNIVWHAIANDSAWMRDNGPVYVVEDGQLRIQDWDFDAWGGAFGEDIPYRLDNLVPARVGEYLGIPVDPVDIVHERGNLEFNGVDTVLLNWSTLGDPARNPGYSRARAEQDLRYHFGVERVLFVEGIPQGDLTRGHIDGFARFIDADTVVVAQCTENSRCRPGDGADGSVYDRAAQTIAAAGFEVIRDPILGTVSYRDATFDTNYLNWLVGNDFVITVGFGHAEADAAAQQRIEGYFPGRKVYVVEMLESWYHGGGVHCHTNDQPEV
ncbi:MAG: agmatine deiminase family protein [Gammaproteobacteria bacterium]|nr:agmatine deiminase family protein [Gammaproteobacteria bacterium]